LQNLLNIKSKKKKSDKSPIVIGSEVAAKVNKDWILAKVSRYFPDKGKYEVIDENIDAEDSLQQHKQYKLDRDCIIPLQPDSSEESKKGSIVLAIYPDTTVFYNATVVKTPSQAPYRGTREYLLKFIDDDEKIQRVAAHHVVPVPNPGI